MRGVWIPAHLAWILLIASLASYVWQRREAERRFRRQQEHQETLIDSLSKAMMVSTSGLEELQKLVPQLVEQLTGQKCRVTVSQGELVLFEAGHENEESMSFSIEFKEATIELGEEPDLAALSALSTLAITLAERVQEIHTALIDAHTGLYGKAHFLHALEYEFERARRYHHKVSVILMDVDLFKEHNDRYGHPSGDAALCELAGILKEHHRRYDTLARYGGEEFAVLLPETGAEDAYELAETYRKEVEKHRFVGRDDTEPARLTISLGVAAFPDLADSPEALLRLADDALYASKNAGRNRTNIAENQAAE